MKKTLAFSLALLSFSVSSVHCVVKNPDTYVYVSISDHDSLDPAWAYDTASHLVIENVYEYLLAYEGGSTEKLIGRIAEKVPSKANGLISKDGLTYTFPIRKGVKFHDGSPLTAEDVRYSILRFCLLDRDGGPSSLLLEPLAGYPSTRDDKGVLRETAYADLAKAVGVEGNSVVIRLPRPHAPLLSELASWSPTVSKAFVAAGGGWDGAEATWKKFNNPASKEASPLHDKVNGSGPYKLERWDKGIKEVTLTRNDGYWRAPAPIARVRIKGINEFNTRKLMLTAGDADAITADWPDYTKLQGLEGVRLIEDLGTVEMNPVLYFTFGIDATANPDIGSGRLDGKGIPSDFFTDPDIRKGFAHAFDYNGFIKDVFRGKATQATGCIPKSLPGHNAAQKTYAYDLKKAEEHFKKAHKGQAWEKGFKFTFSYNEGNNVRQILASIIKRGVERINPKFQVEVRPIQWSTFLDRVNNHKLPVFAMGWSADFPDPHNFAFPLMHSKGNFPVSQGFKDPESDKLVEQGLAEPDMAKRKAIYARLIAREHELAPHIVFVDTTKFRVERAWMKGFVHNPIFPDSPWGTYFYTLSKE